MERSVNHLTNVFFGVDDHDRFIGGLQQAVHSLSAQVGIYAGDQIFTFQRNLGFLGDEKLMTAFARHATTDVERALLWRIAIVAWGAHNGMRREGDFVECACYRGTTARIVCDYLDLARHPDRRYYLYDLFEHDEDMSHHELPEHGKDLHGQVVSRFADVPNVTVTKGRVPDVLATVAPDRIAFMHIDLNNAEAEVGALEILFDRMVPGAILILDDYGWMAYEGQKAAEDPWFERRGYRVAELPTGQGLLVK